MQNALARFFLMFPTILMMKGFLVFHGKRIAPALQTAFSGRLRELAARRGARPFALGRAARSRVAPLR